MQPGNRILDDLRKGILRQVLEAAIAEGRVRRKLDGASEVLFEESGEWFLARRTASGRWCFFEPLLVLDEADIPGLLRPVD